MQSGAVSTFSGHLIAGVLWARLTDDSISAFLRAGGLLSATEATDTDVYESIRMSAIKNLTLTDDVVR
jgi:hypothetical protein